MTWDNPAIGLVSALAGAAAGAWGTHMVERRKEKRSEARGAAAKVQDKVHQLELRMVQVERDMLYMLDLTTAMRRRSR